MESEGEDLRYPVRIGEKRLGTIVLKESGQETEHGFPLYALSQVELALDPVNLPGGVVTVHVPAGYTAAVDGQVLDRSAIVNTYTKENVLPYVPEGYSATADYELYMVQGLSALPGEVTVTSPDGQTVHVTESGSGIYVAAPVGDKQLEAEHAAMIKTAMEKFAAYMQRGHGSGLGNFSKYFDQDTDLYTDIKRAGGDLSFVRIPTSDSIKDEYIGEFQSLGDNAFVCHISFVLDLWRDSEEYPDPVDMYVYAHDTGDGYKIFDWYNNLS